MSENKQTRCFSGLLNLWNSSKTRRKSVLHGHRDEQRECSHSTTKGVPAADDDLIASLHYGSCCNYNLPGTSLEKLPEYSRAVGEAPYKPDVLKTIEDAIDKYSGDLGKLSMDIHEHPEVMFQEKHAHDVLTSFMCSHGFKVTKHYLGLDTAWRAEYTRGKGGRVLGVNSEMDALPGIGHGCGHNLIAMAGVAIALGIKATLDQHHIDGGIVLLGTPAEEGGAGKVILLERGGYEGMDACIMTHPLAGPTNTAQLGTSLAIQTIDVEFFGRTAHASGAPWEGTNALDAAFLTYSSISVLRQQIKPDHRVHGVIKGTDLAANVIPDYTKMSWFVRAPSWPELEVLRERVRACIEAGAMASSCKMKLVLGKAQYDLRQNSVLGRELASILGTEFGWSTVMQQSGGSTDFGNVSHALPSLHPSFTITDADIGAHTPEFRDAAATKKAHEAGLTMSKALALLGFRVIDDDFFFQKVKKTFEAGQRFLN